jgi:DNA-binding winged helix-turn-helix (wHTH) protein/tetratricopeptide (TPR) repeat protein
MDNADPLRLQFDVFELDESDARLTREGHPVALAPKAFAVLCALARQPGQLVTKNALLDTVWGHQHVSESVLKTIVSELRAALSDDARQPRYIETASRRGYRFIGTPTPGQARGAPAVAGAERAQSIALPFQGPPMIGREAALARLGAAWNNAAAGRRQIFWIAGEAGVGKTTLIDNFVARLGPVARAHGQCVEQYGAGEPYLPVLEALGELCRNDPTLVPLLRAVAPTWLLQLPWLSDESEREVLRRELASASQDRMLRELGELLDRHTLQQPLLLVTEDLHWSDHATVRLIDHIARRRGPARLMWLATFRLAEVISEEHALKALRHELRLHRLCEEIVLEPFSEHEVGDYIDRRFPDSEVSEAFVRALHARTDGLPLFLVNVIDDLVSQGLLQPGAGRPLADAQITPLQVPENLAGVIEKQIARLSPQQRTLLEAASVCGVEFRPGTVTQALEGDAGWVGERCDELARRQQWLTALPLGNLPDGSIDARYAFRHALYRHVFYQRIGALTRAHLHRRVAVSMERSRAAGVAVPAAELASHYALGHDPIAALRHYNDAADHALNHFAEVEAFDLTGKALALLARCPEDSARPELELALLFKRGVACSQVLGISSPEARSAFERAQALCELLPETPALGWTFTGLGQAHWGAGEFRAAHAMGERVHVLAERYRDPVLLIAACKLMGMSCAHLGEHHRGQQWLERGIAVCEGLSSPPPYDRFYVDPGASMRGHLGLHLLPTGMFDQARVQVEAGLERARRLRHPRAETLATRCACMVEIGLRCPERVAALVAQLEKLAYEHGIVQAQASYRFLSGWALAHLGDPREGHARIVDGHALLKRQGMVTGSVQILCFAAEALILAERWSEAQADVDEAMALAQRLGERARVPDLLLLRARIELAQGRTELARASMRESLREARAQEALGFELAALVALCEGDDAAPEDLQALTDACGGLSEGFDTLLVKKAHELMGKHAAPIAP